MCAREICKGQFGMKQGKWKYWHMISEQMIKLDTEHKH